MGLPDRPEHRHAIFSPAKFNSYGSSTFPGIGDLLHQIETLTGDEATHRWEQIKRHVSDLMIIIHGATNFLQKPHLL